MYIFLCKCNSVCPNFKSRNNPVIYGSHDTECLLQLSHQYNSMTVLTFWLGKRGASSLFLSVVSFKFLQYLPMMAEIVGRNMSRIWVINNCQNIHAVVFAW